MSPYFMTWPRVYYMNTRCNPAFHSLAPGHEVDDDPRFDVIVELRQSGSETFVIHHGSASSCAGGEFAGFSSVVHVTNMFANLV